MYLQQGEVYTDSPLTFMSRCDLIFDWMLLYFQLGLLWKKPFDNGLQLQHVSYTRDHDT